ncbi:hypothetical protein PHYPSEUDO_011391 [Phytophthora pseudosyringae]|uniref:Uncharacterized protein n=1 Tax=Phytophthora pseudosyringae TaxID=221518 RepID=A0A8T1VBF0_9STRA|nr:hypothetical protein PHYPSEUDO_011391 [Phytophthora pseudosyringae]
MMGEEDKEESGEADDCFVVIAGEEKWNSLNTSVDYEGEVEEEDSFAGARNTEVVQLSSEGDSANEVVVSVVSKVETLVEVSDKGAESTDCIEEGYPSSYAHLFTDARGPSPPSSRAALRGVE